MTKTNFLGILAKNEANSQVFENISYLGLANAVYAAAQWGILIIAAKIGGITVTSRLSLGLAVAVPIMVFFGAGLIVVVSSDIRFNHSFGEYLSTRVLLNGIGLAAIVLFALLPGYEKETVWVILMVGFAKFVEGMQEICWGVLQRREKMKYVGLSRIFRSIGMVLCLGLGLILFRSLVTAIFMWGCFWLVLLVAYDLPNATRFEKLRLHGSPGSWVRILKRAAPLAVVWGIIAFNDKLSIYLLSWLQGENSVGYYAPLSYILQIGAVAMAAVDESMIPRLSFWYQADRRKFIQGGLRLGLLGAGIGFLIFTGSILGGEFFLQFVYRPEYAQYTNVFILLMGTGILRLALAGIGTAVTAAGIYRIQVPIFLAQLAVTGIAGWVLIPKLGLVGAALSSGLGFLIALGLLLVVFMRSTPKKTAL